MRTPTITMLLLLTLASPVHADTIHVPADQPTIQAGIDAAEPGDLVLVAPGLYTGDGNRDVEFYGKAVELRSAAGAEVTIIDCQGSASEPHRGFDFKSEETDLTVVNGFTIRGGYAMQFPDLGSAVRCLDGASPTMRHCLIEHSSGSAAIWCFASSATASGSLTVENCTVSFNAGGVQMIEYGATMSGCSFENNIVDQFGAAISLNGSELSLTACDFVTNDAASGNGGAIRSEDSQLTLVDCWFYDNVPTGLWCEDSTLFMTASAFVANRGDGINGLGSTGAISDCDFRENEGTGALLSAYAVSDCRFVGNSEGGAQTSGEGGCSVVRSVFAYNSAARGGGLYVQCGFAPQIESCTLYGNVATEDGSGLYICGFLPNQLLVTNTIIANGTGAPPVYCEGDAGATLTCCDVYGNEGGDWVGCIAGQDAAPTNFSADPFFCDVAAADFTLAEGSPCAPANSPGACGLIGAVPVACGASALAPATWGGIKGRYRQLRH